MMYDSGDYTGTMKKALELGDVKNFGKRKRDSAKKGLLRGIGYSAYTSRPAASLPPSGRLAWCRCRPVGIGGSARQPGGKRSRV